MQLRFPIRMVAVVRKLHATHKFDAAGERILGSDGDGPRLQECRLRVTFEMQAMKTYAPMPGLQPATCRSVFKRERTAAAPEKPPAELERIVKAGTLERETFQRPGKRLAQRFLL